MDSETLIYEHRPEDEKLIGIYPEVIWPCGGPGLFLPHGLAVM